MVVDLGQSGCLFGMAGRHLGGRADEAGHGARAAGVRPRRHDLAGAEVADRHEDQVGGVLLVRDGDRDVGDGVAERNGVQ